MTVSDGEAPEHGSGAALYDLVDNQPELAQLIAEAIQDWSPPSLEAYPEASQESGLAADPHRSTQPDDDDRRMLFKTRSTAGLAAGSDSTETLSDGTLPGIRVLRRVFPEMGLLDVLIEATPTDPHISFPVLGLYRNHLNFTKEPYLLFLMIAESPLPTLTMRSELRLPNEDVLTSDELELYRSPIEAAVLPPSLMPVVSRSVAAAKLAWKEAWRQAALATPAQHPLRLAVSIGLRDGRVE